MTTPSPSAYALAAYNYATGGLLFLPPCHVWKAQGTKRIVSQVIPKCDGQLDLDRHRGPGRLSISGLIYGLPKDPGGYYSFAPMNPTTGKLDFTAGAPTSAQAQAIWYEMIDFLDLQEVSLFRWENEEFQKCVLTGESFDKNEDPDGMFPFTLEFAVNQPVVKTYGLRSTDGNANTSPIYGKTDSNENPWRHYFPLGTAGATPSVDPGIDPALSSKDTKVISAFFAGQQSAPCAAGYEFHATVVGASTKTFTVSKIMVNGEPQPALGTADTVITISNAPLGSGGDTVIITLAHGQPYAASTSPLSLTGGSDIYAWVSTPGAHVNLNLAINVEEA